MKIWFQAFAFKCNLYRYTLVSVIDASLDAKEAVKALDEVGRCTLTPPDP